MIPLWGHSEIVASFIASLIPNCERGFGPCQAMGVLDRDGNLVGGVVFNNWEPEYGVIEISGASISRRWLTRPVLQEIFAYPFDHLGCQMIVTRVHPESHLRRMWAAVGGEEHVIPRLRGRDTAEVIITVTEEAWRACKFAKESHDAKGKPSGLHAGSERGAGRPAAVHGQRGASSSGHGSALHGPDAAGLHAAGADATGGTGEASAVRGAPAGAAAGASAPDATGAAELAPDAAARSTAGPATGSTA